MTPRSLGSGSGIPLARVLQAHGSAQGFLQPSCCIPHPLTGVASGLFPGPAFPYMGPASATGCGWVQPGSCPVRPEADRNKVQLDPASPGPYERRVYEPRPCIPLPGLCTPILAGCGVLHTGSNLRFGLYPGSWVLPHGLAGGADAAQMPFLLIPQAGWAPGLSMGVHPGSCIPFPMSCSPQTTHHLSMGMHCESLILASAQPDGDARLQVTQITCRRVPITP